jgi:hypothetical protein
MSRCFILLAILRLMVSVGLAQTETAKLTPGYARSDTGKSETPKAGQVRPSGLPQSSSAGSKQDKKPAAITQEKPGAPEFGKEMELETISIEAVIEKPNVDIIPKRAEPDLGEVEFIDRSFESELKAIPKDLLLIDDELDRATKLEGLKKLLAKKRKQ